MANTHKEKLGSGGTVGSNGDALTAAWKLSEFIK